MEERERGVGGVVRPGLCIAKASRKEEALAEAGGRGRRHKANYSDRRSSTRLRYRK